MPKPSPLIIGCLVWLMATAGALSAEEVSNEGKLWTTRWSFEEVNVAKLANRLKSIGLDLGIDLKGIVTADLAVGVPWRSPGDAAAYRFHGKLTSPKLAVESFELQDLVAVVDYRDGVLKMTKLSSSMLDDSGRADAPDKRIGKLVGEAALQLVPREDATAELTIEDLPLAPFSDLINKLLGSESDLVAQRGRASGEISFRAPLNQIRDVATYRLDGTLVCQDVKVPGIPALNIEIGQVEIREARLKVRELDASTRTLRKGNRDIRVLGSADLPLDGRGSFSAELLGDNVPLSELASLLIPSSGKSSFAILKGKLDFRVSGTGELAANADETTWTIEGSVASPSLQLAGVEVGVLEHRVRFTPNRFEMQPLDQESPLPEAVIIERVVTQHQITPDALVLKAFNASVFGGTIAGSGNWPRSEKGDVAVNATVDAIRPVWRLPLVGSLTAPVTASLSGKVNWQVPIQKLQEPSAHQGTAFLTASDIRVGQERIGELQTNVAATPESFSLESKGRLFDGTIEIASTADLRSTSSWPGVIRQLKSAKLKFNEVSVGSLINLLAGERLRVSGKASGQAVTRSGGSQENLASVPRLKLTAELSDIRHKANLLSKEVELNGSLENRTVTIQNIAGDYAGGSFQSNGRIDLFDPDNNFSPRTDLRVRASRISADRGLWFIGERSERFSGSLSARGQLTGSGEFFRLRGSCDGRGLAAYGLPLGVAHSSLLGSVSLRSMKWKLALPSIHSNLGVGRVEGQVHLASAHRGGVNLSSRWKARRVDVFALARRAGQSTTPTRGEVSGVLTLDGKSLRSVDDLTGRFDVDIEHTSGSAIPGLVAASQLLTTVSLVNQNFEVGEAKGTISNGVMAIEEFWIGSNQAIVRADGKVYLASRRLDLQALIATGDYKDIAGNFAELVQRNAIAAILPASAILSVSELLRDRTLVVGVTGTLPSPIVRLRAVETFREEVARFLLREGQRLILAGSAIGAIDGASNGF